MKYLGENRIEAVNGLSGNYAVPDGLLSVPGCSKFKQEDIRNNLHCIRASGTFLPGE